MAAFACPLKVGWVELCEAHRHGARWASPRSSHPTSCTARMRCVGTRCRSGEGWGGGEQREKSLSALTLNLSQQERGFYQHAPSPHFSPLVAEFARIQGVVCVLSELWRVPLRA